MLPPRNAKKELNRIIKELPLHIQEQIRHTFQTYHRNLNQVPLIFYPATYPIVPSTGIITERISGYLDCVLRPFAIKDPS